MHFIQPMHLQGYVSQHHQVACGETHRVPWGIPLGLLEGVIVEGDHDLSLQIFRINHNCNCEVSGSYMLQLASAALSIPSSPSPQVPSPKSQVPSPKSQVQEAGKLWMPWCRWYCTSSLVPTLLCCSTLAPSCPLCFTGALIDPAAPEYWKLIGYIIRQWWLNFGRSSLGLQYTCPSGQALTTSLVSSVCAYNIFTYCMY